MSDSEHWHLDKRVPITLILTILAQTGVAVWFASSLSSRVEANTVAITKISNSALAQDERVRINTNTLSRVDETLRNLENTLERIDQALDRLEEK